MWVVSLLERIAGRRAELAEQAERLRKELAEVEAELARVGPAEQVVTQLLASQEDEAGGEREPAAAGQRPVAPVVPPRASGARAEDLPADYRGLLQIVAGEGAGGQAVACKRITAKLGLTAEPWHTETVRDKLKRLAARGWLAEATPGRFAVRP